MAMAMLTSKGQITIPKEIRDAFMLNTGDKVEFIITKGGDAIFRPVTKKVDDLFGRLHKAERKPVALEKMDAGIRGKIKEDFK
jgi:AbrB family looped-hinge helix DNA binding protein